MAQLSQVAAQMNVAMSTLNVELQQFPDLVTRMNILMERTDRLLEGVQRSWVFSSDEELERRRLIQVEPP